MKNTPVWITILTLSVPVLATVFGGVLKYLIGRFKDDVIDVKSQLELVREKINKNVTTIAQLETKATEMEEDIEKLDSCVDKELPKIASVELQLSTYNNRLDRSEDLIKELAVELREGLSKLATKYEISAEKLASVDSKLDMLIQLGKNV